jgi:hypothetical protein
MIYQLSALGRFAAAKATLVLCGSLATKATANGNHQIRHAYGRGHVQRDYGVGWGWTACTAIIKDQSSEKGEKPAISVALNLVTAGTRARTIG